MKRQSYKYIFYLNFLFIAVCAIITFFSAEQKVSFIRASVTTPIKCDAFEQQAFCKTASSAVIIDGKSGAVLFEKNALSRLPMASTTKIMTALAVITHADLDAVVTVSRKAAHTEGSSIYLKEGEQISVTDLLYGLMLESGNDAAVALAEGCFGSEEKCVEAMNALCKSYGLIDTNFDNVHGLDSSTHYTTSYELARITAIALKNETFCKITSTKNYTTSGETQRFFSNHHRLLRTYDGCIGVKTGYTSLSGRCLVTAAQRDTELYIAVTLNDRNDWQDHREMLDFAFENYSCREIASDGFVIYNGSQKYIPSESIYLTVRGEDDFTLDYKMVFSKDSSECSYSCDGEILGHFALIPQKDISMPQAEDT